ncbi:MAG: hypothetical protein M1381_03435 [Deltaproteobacteria bacterium]|nr:hypothetical protein [Deltaproteobacteria bacterium]MCL5792826.1 hypothetical protein [Deltaproteobacteria bacterium]
MTPPAHKKLGEMLLEHGIIDQTQLRVALSNQKQYGGRLGTVIVKLGFLKDMDILKFLSKQLGIQMVDLYKITIDKKVLNLIHVETVEKYNILPLAIKAASGKPSLYLAMSDPTNLEAIDAVQFAVGYKIQPVLALESTISDFINYYYKDKPLPAKINEPILTQKDEELSVKMDKYQIDSHIKQDELEKNTEEPLENQLQPFIKALIAILIKKGIFTLAEFKETLSEQDKKH